MSRARSAAAVAVAVCAILAVTLSGALVPAQAHAALTGSSPAQGASLTRAPTKVTLRYDENIRDPSVIIVAGPDGKRVDHHGTRVVNNTASVDVAARQRGSYTVSYRVISADGHPVSGTVRFSFGGKGAPASSTRVASPRPDPTSHTTAWIVGGGVVLVAILALWLVPGRRRRGDASTEEHGAS